MLCAALNRLFFLYQLIICRIIPKNPTVLRYHILENQSARHLLSIIAEPHQKEIPFHIIKLSYIRTYRFNHIIRAPTVTVNQML